MRIGSILRRGGATWLLFLMTTLVLLRRYHNSRSLETQTSARELRRTASNAPTHSVAATVSRDKSDVDRLDAALNRVSTNRAEPRSPPFSERRTCESAVLFHGLSLEEIDRRYERTGSLRWPVVDAFVMRDGNPCPFNAPCPKSLPVVSVVLMARVWRMSPFNMTNRLEKAKRRQEYAQVMSAKVRVKCEFSSTSTTVSALPLTGDGDKHTLIVNCPIPAIDLAAGLSDDGRLRSLLKITITDGTAPKESKLLLSLANIAACNNELVSRKVDLGTCTMFGEMSPLRTADVAAMWTRFMLASGFQFVVLYLDPVGDADELRSAVESSLKLEIAKGSVRTVLFHMTGRYSLQTQSAQENHCQWRFRGRSRWLAQLDLDEFLQPLGEHESVASVIQKYDQPSGTQYGALQIRNRFWDHHPIKEKDYSRLKFDAWNMIWRDGRPTVSGREKIISRPELVDYIAVHKVTTGLRSAHPDPEKELRHNHFSRHFKGYDEGAHCGSSFRAGGCNNAMKDPIPDVSFREYYHKIIGTKP
eukprot:m.24040 g.24040  ORF g.24040 m.24040 type:complete len:530 (-) comp6020_c0_seq1:985-2574(-)